MASLHYNIEYYLTTSLGDDSATNYISSYEGNIVEESLEDARKIIVGKLKLDILHLDRAHDNNFPLIEIFDNDDQLINMAEHIFDFDDLDFKEEIREFYDGIYISNNICLIRKIELLATHRGKGLGSMILKDIYDRFSSSCGLIALEAYPLQFSKGAINTYDDKDLEWNKKLDYPSLSNDFEKSFYKLKAFYQKSGFHHIENFDKWMFVNPGIINSKLNN